MAVTGLASAQRSRRPYALDNPKQIPPNDQSGKEWGTLSKLSEILNLPEPEKASRGLLHTPGEIAQQPATWHGTFARVKKQSSEIQSYLRSVGVGGDPAQSPTVFLVGAGTSDYIGRSLVAILRRRWQCEVFAIPST